MNRTIKFRAWDTKKKGWKGMWIFRGGHSGEYDVSNTEIDVLDLTNKWGSNVKVMQFTGLYDCEGKEIYESDIVEASWGYTGVVDFEEILFYKYECRISDDIKVIGNIHEQLLD